MTNQLSPLGTTRGGPVRPGWGRRARRIARIARRTIIHAGIGGLAVAIAVAGCGQQPAFASPTSPGSGYQKLQPQRDKSVPAGPATARPKQDRDPAAAAARTGTPAAAVWPKAATGIVQVPQAAGAKAARVASTPVSVAAAHPGEASTPSAVEVSVLDPATADRATRPVVLRVNRADSGVTSGTVAVTVDYSGFKNAYGGDWATRLTLVSLPECALTTPGAPQCQATPLATRNTGSALTATLTVDGATTVAASAVAAASGYAAAATVSVGTLVAAQAAASGAAGDFGATSLSPSSTWSSGTSAGDFTWSYPLRVPPSLNGPAPQIGLSYSSQSVDGRTAATNNQPSWLGEGFDLSSGYIERRYKSCSDDMGTGANNTTKTYDECWGNDNATMSLGSSGGELVRDDATGAWHPRNDDGSRIELLTGATNGDNDGEYWKVTTPDGTQYFFGLNHITGWGTGKAETQSAWTVPVYGNNTGEPCHQTTYDASWCQQAWRWNLDYVVDTHGNTMSYWYAPESNNYARNLDSTKVSTYTRGGSLARIDYGTRSEAEFGYAPMRVNFAVADRCAPGATCDTAHPASWPDTPWDQSCTSATSCTVYSPTFFTQKRLASVTTQVRSTDTTYQDVDRWTLTHSYPDPGDTTRAGLWLAAISHSGLVGSTKTVPDVTFTGIQMANRVDTSVDQRPAMNWWRVRYIDTESGGRVGVTYSDPDCAANSRIPSSPESNTLRCYPVKWTPSGWSAPTTDYFHKYVVRSVTETDNVGGAVRTLTSYDYPNPPAWHYTDEDGLVQAAQKTWAVWRGYDTVVTTKGEGTDRRQSTALFFRGMDGDHLPSGTRQVSVTDSTGGVVADADQYAGTVRETRTLDGPAGAEVGGSITDMWSSAPTSTRVINGVSVSARYTRAAGTRSRTVLDNGRAPRTTETATSYDAYGMPTQAWDKGEPGDADDQCTATTYVRNPTAWIMNRASRVESYARPCGTAPTSQADVLADTRTSYDTQDFGAAPTRGDVTRSEAATAWSAASGPTYAVMSQASYDAYGRVTQTRDVYDKATTIAYTQSNGGPVTTVTTTNPMGWTSSTNPIPAWGVPASQVDVNGKRTDITYDPLGRVMAVWRPGRDKATQTANATFDYLIQGSAGPSAVTTNTLNAAGKYQTSVRLFAGLLARAAAPDTRGRWGPDPHRRVLQHRR